MKREVTFMAYHGPMHIFYIMIWEKDKMRNLGPISQKGEAGVVGKDYRVICRSMFIDDKTGLAYFSTSEGDIFSYDP